MIQKLNIFTIRFNDEELEEELHKFFNVNNLLPLFSNEHRANHITVSYVEARSVVNPTGKYRRVFEDFSEVLTIANDNKSYEEALFKIIYESRTMQGLVNKLKRYMKYINQIDQNHLHNTWNIVWYNKQLR